MCLYATVGLWIWHMNPTLRHSRLCLFREAFYWSKVDPRLYSESCSKQDTPSIVPLCKYHLHLDVTFTPIDLSFPGVPFLLLPHSSPFPKQAPLSSQPKPEKSTSWEQFNFNTKQMSSELPGPKQKPFHGKHLIQREQQGCEELCTDWESSSPAAPTGTNHQGSSKGSCFPGSPSLPVVNCVQRTWSECGLYPCEEGSHPLPRSGRVQEGLCCIAFSNARPTDLSVCGHWAGMYMCVAYLQSQPTQASLGTLIQRRKYWMT